MRGIPSTCEEQEVVEALNQLGHKAMKATNIKKFIMKDGKKVEKKLPLFLVELKQDENNKKLFETKYLLHCKIVVEAPRKSKAIPQCQKCQKLGHTKNFCTRPAVCVKCAESHPTASCTKKLNEKPKCALCEQEGHTANYKGCSVYQKKLKSQTQQVKPTVARLQEKNKEKPSMGKKVETGLSFAQVTKSNTEAGKENKNKSQKKEPSISDLLEMLTKIQSDIGNNISILSKRLDKMESKLSKPNANKPQSQQKQND